MERVDKREKHLKIYNMSKRALDRLGFIRVLHKDSGKTHPIAPKMFANKQWMASKGYIEIPQPEAPKVEEPMKIVIHNTNDAPKAPIEAQIEPQIKVKAPRKTRKKKTIKKEVDNGN